MFPHPDPISGEIKDPSENTVSVACYGDVNLTVDANCLAIIDANMMMIGHGDACGNVAMDTFIKLIDEEFDVNTCFRMK